MKAKRLVAMLAAIMLTASLTGCGEDSKKAAADALDALGNLAQEALEEAPSGEEIVGAVEGAGDAIGHIANDIGESFRKGQENNAGIPSGILE